MRAFVSAIVNEMIVSQGKSLVRVKQIPFTVPPTSGGAFPTQRQAPHLEELNSVDHSLPIVRRGYGHETVGVEALGSIDPSLYMVTDDADDAYELPPDHLGRLWFAVEYERETEKLYVTLLKARNLPFKYGTTNGCDPFVRVYLMPDDRRFLQSKFKKKTCNPTFDESYVFQVSSRNFSDRILKFTVYDVDRQKKHLLIGHALYPLKDHQLENNERLVIWRDLDKEVVETTHGLRGEIKVSLCYNDRIERITVGVYEGRALANDTASHLDSYVKVQLMVQNKTVKTKKTEIVRKSSEPVFNESFTFKLPAASLDTANVTVTAMQHQTGYKDKVIGKVTIGSFMFCRGKELQQWNEMVGQQTTQVVHWQQLVD
ncbi:synaptotagmin-15-like isoform X2 [Dreissena polymorpha]|uniref:synaptotagmin-15-like isoform X2 n=1 Tax=Dreissena polymorpha TaxID=45954 RepID=UPI0022645AC2|nr:synaptotagmin-15-like isoform X2 [Dreissena polymorpha]